MSEEDLARRVEELRAIVRRLMERSMEDRTELWALVHLLAEKKRINRSELRQLRERWLGEQRDALTRAGEDEWLALLERFNDRVH